MIGFILDMPDSLALFIVGIAMFLTTLVLRKLIDSSEPSVEKVEETGVETR